MPLLPNIMGAMPVITSFGDCASFAKTVSPYIPQLYALPNTIYAHLTNPSALLQIYTDTNPIISGFSFSLALFPIFLILSEINRNYSQVDRVWSILPAVFHIHYAVWARLNGLPTDKVDLATAFSVIWSARLTFNYWRKGGYQIGSEDYRWELIKKQIGQPGFFLLNVFFISSLQVVRLVPDTFEHVLGLRY
jgi:hypothetical protein